MVGMEHTCQQIHKLFKKKRNKSGFQSSPLGNFRYTTHNMDHEHLPHYVRIYLEQQELMCSNIEDYKKYIITKPYKDSPRGFVKYIITKRYKDRRAGHLLLLPTTASSSSSCT